MSIRQIAIELYRSQRQVEELENRLAEAPYAEKEEIREKLRIAQAEHRQLKNILEGEKTPPPSGFRPGGFGR